MELNGDKCHLMIFGEKSNDLSIKIESTAIVESREGKMLGVTLEKRIFIQDTRIIFMQESRPKASPSFAYFLLT